MIRFAMLSLLLSGCTIAPAYVEADRLTFEAIGPEYRAYVVADPLLDDGQKARRKRTLTSWEARMEAAEPDPGGGE